MISKGRRQKKDYDFTVRLNRAPLTDAEFDAIFEAGLDDANVTTTPDGRASLMVSRQAGSMAEAIVSVVADIEAAGFAATGVEAEDLLTLAAIGRRVGRSRESMRLLAAGKRGPGGFPAAVTSGPSPLYSWTQVRAWMEDHNMDVPAPDVEHDAVVAADLLIRAHVLMPDLSGLASLVSA